jgi:hypothetical protein
MNNCSTDRSYWASRGGVMNDSMAILNTVVFEEEFCSAFGAGGETKYRFRECKLILADIRKKEIYGEIKISNKDCDDNSMGLTSIQDSILIFIGTGGSVVFLELGSVNFQQTKQVELKSKKMKFEGSEWKYKSLEAGFRPWQNGMMLLNSKYEISRDDYGNEYALLDTVSGIMKLWEPSGEFEWLNDCVDAKWSLAGGLCLKEILDTLGFVLLKNGVDTLAARYMPHELSVNTYFFERRPLVFSGNSIISKGWIYLIDDLGQVSEKPLDTWTSQMGVFHNHGRTTNYGIKYF